ncbi:hypothetical protein [Streptomyces hirsutus]|uniref:hypothetical protein n=1 Tax=Streptomyces hirsutus TaxID=35620 RepID=UPI003323F78A
MLAFANSDVGRKAFDATRAPEVRRALDGDGTVRWNAKTRTLSLICPGKFVVKVKKAYSARVRKWTTDNIDWLQRFIEEHLTSHLSGDVQPDSSTAALHPSEELVNADPNRVHISHASAQEKRETPASGYRKMVEELRA